MLVLPSLALLSLVPLVASRPHQAQAQARFRTFQDSDCPSTYLVPVRGTLETEDAGAMRVIIEKLLQEIPNSYNQSVEYPAAGIIIHEDKPWTLDPWMYSASKTQGGDVARNLLNDFHEYCPDTPIVLMGYSQGAHVVGDVVCGVWPGLWPVRYAISKEVKKQIKAVVQFGDPSNVRDLDWHRGTSTQGGMIPRVSFSACKDLADRWVSYCDEGDMFCDRGKELGPHQIYHQKYFDDVIKFILDKVSTKSKSGSKSKSRSKSSAHCELEFEL